MPDSALPPLPPGFTLDNGPASAPPSDAPTAPLPSQTARSPTAAPEQQQGLPPLPPSFKLDGPNSSAQPSAPQGPTPADYSQHVAVMRSILGSKADNDTVRKQISDYAVQNGIPIANGLDNVLSYRQRAGAEAAARDTNFENIGAQQTDNQQQQDNTPIVITARPKPEPNGQSEQQSFLIGAAESVPGIDRIMAGVGSGLETPVQDVGNWLGLTKDAPGFVANYDKELQHNRDEADQAWDDNPGNYGVGFGAGMVPQMLIGTGEASLAEHAPQAAELLSHVPGWVQAGAKGATAAGVYSLGGTRQDLSTAQGWKNAGKQAAVDAAIGAGVGTVAHGLTSRATSMLAKGEANPASTGQDILDAANTVKANTGVDVPVTPPMVGGTLTRKLAGGMGSTLVGGSLIRNSAGRTVKGLGDAVSAVSNSMDPAYSGVARDVGAQLLNTAHDSDSLATLPDRLQGRWQNLYADAENKAGGYEFGPGYAGLPNTMSDLSSKIAQLKTQPTATQQGLDKLQTLYNDLLKPQTLDNLRSLRTNFGKQLDDASPEVRSVANSIWGNLSQDVDAGLRGAGLSDAANAYRKADSAFSNGQDHIALIDQMLGPVDDRGNRTLSAEKVVDNINYMTRKNAKDLQNTMRLMSSDDRGGTQAMILNQLARATDSNQNAAGTAVSTQSLLANYNKLSDGTKRLIFNGPVRDTLNALATLSEGAKNGRVYENASKTAHAGNIIAILEALAETGGSVMTGHGAAGAIGTMATQAGLSGTVGALLSSPRVGRVLVNYANGTFGPTQMAARLTALAARTPAQSAQLLGLRDRLLGRQHPASIQTNSKQNDQ